MNETPANWEIVRRVAPIDLPLTDDECRALMGSALVLARQGATRSEGAYVAAQYLKAEKRRMWKERLRPGAPCAIRPFGWSAANWEIQPFIGSRCVMVKRTKAGRIQIADAAFPKQRISVNERCIELLEAA